MSQEQAPPSTWSKTKGGFSAVGKGAGAARTGINSGLSKLDSMSVSKKGLSFKKEMSGQNISYDRDNHVSRPKMDVSHLPPPPRRIPGQAPPPATRPAAARPATTSTRPSAPSPAPRPSPPIPSAPRPAAAGAAPRAVPLPPPVAAKPITPSEEPLPVYTATAGSVKTDTMNNLSSRMNSLKTSTPSSGAGASSTPSMNEAKSAYGSAKTMGGLYGKYGNQQPGQKTATPSWSEVKAGAAAAQNLHAFHGKYAPKQDAPGAATTNVVPTPEIVAPKPINPAQRAPLPTPSPKPPLPKAKPGPKKEYCIALFEFDGEAPGDLAFAVGDKIEVLERTPDADAWWKGKLNGQEGIFPGNYCRLETA